MPFGLEDSTDRSLNLYRIGKGQQVPQYLPQEQLDPFMREVVKLKQMGLIPNSIDDTKVARQTFLNPSFRTTGQISNGFGTEGVFSAGSLLEDPEILEQLRLAQDFASYDKVDQTAKFTPREETEPGGFFKLLEFFQTFNYGIAGALNAVINAAQGETEQTNPWVEFWSGALAPFGVDGFDDRETFKDVFENLGWDGEDGISYYSRWTLGLVADIALDPLTYITLGSTGTKVISAIGGKGALRLGALKKFAPVRKNMVDKIIAATKVTDDVVASSNPRAAVYLTELRNRSRVARFEAEAPFADAISAQGARLAGIDDVTKAKIVEDSARRVIEDDVQHTIESLLFPRNAHRIRADWREVGQDWHAFLGRQGVDGAFGGEVLHELLKLEGKSLTFEDYLSFMKKGRDKYIDTGGLKIKMPFVDKEMQLISAEWMDRARFSLATSVAERWAKTSKSLGKYFDPTGKGAAAAVGKIGQKGGAVAKSVYDLGVLVKDTSRRWFGANLNKFPEFRQIDKEFRQQLDVARRDSALVASSITHLKNAKGRSEKLPQEINDAIFDAIQREQDSAAKYLSDGHDYFSRESATRRVEQLRALGKTKEADELAKKLDDPVLGYEEKHLPQLLSNDGPLAAYTPQERQAFLDIARGVTRTFQDQYDWAVSNGLERAYIAFYVPHQYKNATKRLSVKYKEEYHKVASDKTVFDETRTMSSATAAKLGLVHEKDLTTLLYGSMYAAKRAVLSRRYYSKLIRKFGVHENQIQHILATQFGAQNDVGRTLLESLRGSQAQREALAAFGPEDFAPQFEEAHRLIERGDFDLGWFGRTFTTADGRTRSNAELLLPSMGKRGESLLVTLEDKITETTAKLDEFIRSFSEGYQSLIGDSIVDLRDILIGLPKLGVNLDRDLAKTLGDELEAAVVKRLGLSGESPSVTELAVEGMIGRRAEGISVGSKRSKQPGAVRAAKDLSGTDGAHLVVLDHLLADAKKVDLTPELKAHVEKVADALAERLKAVSDASLGGASIRYAGFDDRMARLSSRFFFAEVLEQSITESKEVVTAALRFGPVREASLAVDRLANAGLVEEAAQLAQKTYDRYGSDPLFHAAEMAFRRNHPDLPVTSFGDLDDAARIAVVAEAKDHIDTILPELQETVSEVGAGFFSRPLFEKVDRAKPAGLGDVRSALREEVRAAIDRAAGNDEVFRKGLENLVYQSPGSRAGTHYNVSKGVRDVLVHTHAARGSRWLSALKSHAQKTSPRRAVRSAAREKLAKDSIVSSVFQSPSQFTKVVSETLESQTREMADAFQAIAERVGAEPKAARAIANRLHTEIIDSYKIGREAPAQMSRAFEASKGVADRAVGEIANLIRDPEMGIVLRQALSDWGEAMVESQARAHRTLQMAEEVQSQVAKVVTNPHAILTPDEQIVLRTHIDEITEMLDQLQGSILERTGELGLPIPSTAVGRANAERLFDGTEVVREHLEVVAQFRKGLDRLSAETQRTLEAQTKTFSEAVLADARRSAESLKEEMFALESELEPLVRAVNSLDSVENQVYGGMIQHTNALATTVVGRDVDLLDPLFDAEDLLTRISHSNDLDPTQAFLALTDLAVVDEYLRGASHTSDDWAAARAKVLTDGPSSEGLRSTWNNRVHPERSGAGNFANDPINAAREMTAAVVRAIRGDHLGTLFRQRSTHLRDTIRRVAEGKDGVIAGGRMAELEASLFEKLNPLVSRQRSLALQYDEAGKPSFEAAIQFNRWLKYQLLRAEDYAVDRIRKTLPSLSEMIAVNQRALAKGLPEERMFNRLLGSGDFDAGHTIGGVFDRDQVAAIRQMQRIQWDDLHDALPRLLSQGGRTVLQRTGIDILDVNTVTEFRESLELAETVAEFNGRWITIHDEDITDGVNEVIAYLKLNKGDGLVVPMTDMPSTELQRMAIQRVLSRFSSNSDERSRLLLAISSTARVDRLNFVEASHVIDQLEARLGIVRSSGGVPLPADRRFLAAQTKGLLPESLKREADGGQETFRKALAGEEDLGDYQPIDLTLPGMDTLTDEFGNTIDATQSKVALPRALADALSDRLREEMLGRSGPMQAMLRHSFDPLTNAFKVASTIYFPAFHLRNALDAGVRAMLGMGAMALNPVRARHMWNLLRDKEGRMVVGGQEIEYGVLRHWLEKSAGVQAIDEKLALIRQTGGDDLPLSFFRVESPNYALGKVEAFNQWIRTVAGFPDNFFRASVFVDGLDRGMTMQGSAARMHKFLFDYTHGLTPFERQWMRRAFPFYTFARFNIPLALETMFKHPGLISALGHTNHLMGDNDLDEILPNHVKDQWRVTVGRTGNELRVMSGQNLISLEDIGFLGDLQLWRGDDFTETMFREVTERLNPMLKVPVEIMMDRNLYLNREIMEDQKVRNMALDYPVLRDYLQLRQVKVGDEVFYRVNGDRWHALRSAHMGRIYRTFSSFFAQDDSSATERMLPFVTGLRVQKIDLDRRMDHLRMMSNFNRGAIVKALREGDWVQMSRLATGTERTELEERRLIDAMKLADKITR